MNKISNKQKFVSEEQLLTLNSNDIIYKNSK